jgi:GTP cyclohydrolase FolE2
MTAPVSGIASLQVYVLLLSTLNCASSYELRIGVKVPVTTLCPCPVRSATAAPTNQRSFVHVVLTYTISSGWK